MEIYLLLLVRVLIVLSNEHHSFCSPSHITGHWQYNDKLAEPFCCENWDAGI